MVTQTNIIYIGPDDPCPCRSGKATRDCCMEPDGTLRVKFPAPVPPGALSGFSNPQCCLRDTRNCSEEISADHYVSKNLLDMISGRAVEASLLRCDGRTDAVGIELFTASVACSRHNTALLPLDAVAIQTFSNLFDAISYVIKKSLATKRMVYAASGEGLELWALKLLFGAQATLSANDPELLHNVEGLEAGVFQGALEGNALSPPCGLYLKGRMGRANDSVGRGEPTGANRIRGLRFTVAALEFELIVQSAGTESEAMGQQYYYRPSSIDFVGKKRSANILLSGTRFSVNQGARFGLTEARAQ